MDISKPNRFDTLTFAIVNGTVYRASKLFSSCSPPAPRELSGRGLHSSERVDVISEQVGYADVTHFIRLFRRAHGATPAAWRAAQRRALPQLGPQSSVE